MEIPQPKWLEEMPDGLEKLRAENRFFFNLWCLYASQEGTLKELARLLDINHSTLCSQAVSHNVRGATDATKEAIRRLLGPDFIPSRSIPDRRFRNVK